MSGEDAAEISATRTTLYQAKSDLIQQIANAQEYPDLLYHYTSQANLINIVKGNKILLSNTQSMNDPLETKYGIKLLKWFAEKHHLSEVEKLLKWVVEKVPDFQSYDRPTFVFSMTKNKDRMNDWINYGDSGSGVCLEFDTRKLLKVLFDQKLEQVLPLVIPVFYVDIHDPKNFGKNKEFLDSVVNFLKYVDEVLSNGPYHLSNLKRDWGADSLMLIASLIKSTFHEEEQECRLLMVLDGPGVLEKVDVVFAKKTKGHL